MKFDWKKLDQYKEDKPFFLSGGIQSTDINDIKGIKNNELYAIDVNSKFEIELGIKDIPKLKTFIKEVRK